jgi:hypothetical protein
MLVVTLARPTLRPGDTLLVVYGSTIIQGGWSIQATANRVAVGTMRQLHGTSFRFEVLGKPIESYHEYKDTDNLHISQNRNEVYDKLLVEVQLVDIDDVHPGFSAAADAEEVGVDAAEVAIGGE